jgi:CRISPR-associated protein Cas1
MLPPLKPIPIKERLSIVFVEKGEIDVVDGAFVVFDQQGFRVRPVLTDIPVGGVACIMLAACKAALGRVTRCSPRPRG